MVQVNEGDQGTSEAILGLGTGIALRAEKDGALVVIDAMDFPTEGGEMDADFGADESGGAGDEEHEGGGRSDQ